jgi:hypothetical protein
MKNINDFIKKNPNLSSKEGAEKCGISRQAYRTRKSRLGVKEVVKKLKPKEVLNNDKQNRQTKIETSLIKKQYQLLLKENEILEQNLKNAMGIKENTSHYVITKSPPSRGDVVPIILASDWHLEELIKGETINNLNDFNLEIADKRVENFFKNSVRLIEKEKQDSNIDTIILALLGDFISGNIHDVLLPICQLLPMDAILKVQGHLIAGIKYILNETKVKHLIIPCTVGNHSRITPKVWIATENGYSLEYFMYHNLKSVFASDKRVQFVISNSQHCYLDIWNYKLRFLHGTQIKYSGGIGGFTIPANKKIQMWGKAIPAYYTFLGHLHQLFDANPNFIVNGCLIGFSSYALAIGAEFQKPCQAIVMLSKRWGKAGVNPVFLD